MGPSCVRFSFRDAAGNVGSLHRMVTVVQGTATTPQTPMPGNAVDSTGEYPGVTVEFLDDVTGSGTTAAACFRNPATTTAADFRLDVKPVWPSCDPLPDGTPRQCGAPWHAFPPPFTIACDVSTTAQYRGLIKVCFPHRSSNDTLWHYNTALARWEDITIRPVQANQPICGLVSSLSPFLVDGAPVVILPADIVTEAAGPAGAAASYVVNAVDWEDGLLPAACSPASGSVFPLGTTPVICTAADPLGASGSGTFHVTVVDTTAPAVTAPAPITVEATETGGASGASSPELLAWLEGGSAVDLVDPALQGGAGATPSTLFPTGTTTVTFRFTDASGNAGTATSTVTVVTGRPRLAVSVAGRGRYRARSSTST